MRSSLKSDTTKFVHHCYRLNSSIINLSEARQILSISRRRMHDIVTILSGVGAFKKIKVDQYELIGLHNLYISQNIDWYRKKQTNIRLVVLAQLIFRDLMQCKTFENYKVMFAVITGKSTPNNPRMSRRVYDVLNVFEGAGILSRHLKRISSLVGDEGSAPSGSN